jgi:uncharacterized integral membrane protein
MKSQWYLLAGVIFTIIVSIFAVLNVAPVEVNFLFGTAEWPLVLVILFSTLMGIVIAGSIGIYQIIMLKRKLQHMPSDTEIITKEIQNKRVREKRGR